MIRFIASNKLLCGLQTVVLRTNSFTAANMGLPQAGLDKLTLAFYRYQSSAMGLTV
jgi:hypothetical protein